MKQKILFLGLVLLLCNCNQNKNTSEDNQNTNLDLDGVWKLTSYFNYKDNKIADTIFALDNDIQMKIFLDNRVMWSRRVPEGQSEYFGYGSYSITDSTLTEVIEYGSSAMLKAIDTTEVFSFELIKGDDTFTQIEIDPEGNRIFSENYIRIKD